MYPSVSDFCVVAATGIEPVYHFARKRLKPIYSAKQIKRKLTPLVYACRSQVNLELPRKNPT